MLCWQCHRRLRRSLRNFSSDISSQKKGDARGPSLITDLSSSSMYAHRLEFLLPGIRDCGLATIGEHDRRAVGGVQRKQLQAGCDFGGLREQGRNVLRADCFQICYPDSQFVNFVEPYSFQLIAFIDCNRFNDPLRLRPHKIDRQQSVLQVRTHHLHSISQYKGALELARGNATVDVLPALVVLLTPANNQLTLLNRDIELVAGEPCHRQGNSQPIRAVPLVRNALDVVRWITVGGLADAIEHALDLVEAEQKWARK
jgi:hypothetical protein